MERFLDFYKDKSIVDNYDNIRMHGFKAGINREIELLTLNNLIGKGKILEIGCGTGFITQLLDKKGQVVAVDPSKEMIKIAKKRTKNSIFINKSLFDYNGKNFDYVVSFRVLGHFEEKEFIRSLNKIHSFLKKDGTFIFNLENKSVLRKLIRKFRKNRVETYQYSRGEIINFIENNGFKIIELYSLDHFFILSPLYLLNKIFLGKFRGFILKIEKNMIKKSFSSVNWLIKCRKK